MTTGYRLPINSSTVITSLVFKRFHHLSFELIILYRTYTSMSMDFDIFIFFESSTVLAEDFFVVQKKTALAKPSKSCSRKVVINE